MADVGRFVVMRIAQISDPHFGTEQPPVVEALVDWVRVQAPDLVVLSGDITQRARPAQFAAARAFFDRLAVPVLAVPGNHDLPAFNLALRFIAPYARYAAAFGRDREPVVETDEAILIGVDATRRWRFEHGTISAAQVDAVARRLAGASPSQLRIVVAHQPIAVSRPVDAKNRLHGHARAARGWAEAGVDVVMGGHIHLPYVRPLHEVEDGLPKRMWCVQAGTAVSRRVRHEAPNSVNLLRYEPLGAVRRCTVERWDWQAASRVFAPVGVNELDCGQLDRGSITPTT